MLVLAAACGSNPAEPDAGPIASLELVGHSDLMARGMNSALAVIGDYVYVGSRTDGVVHENAGVLIVDASDPTDPRVVGEIGAPDQALLGMSSRELRAVPDKNLLIVLNFACSPDIHACRYSMTSYPSTGGAQETDNLKFYDVSNPVAPVLVSTFDFGSHPLRATVRPHEMFLWRDPADAERLLLYVSTPVGPPAMQVLDLSDLQNIRVAASFDPELDAGLDEPRSGDALLHSVSTNHAGDVAYISYQAAGLLLADTSELASGTADPVIRLLSPVDARPDWNPPTPAGPHSAVEIPGRDLVLVTDEVYPAPAFPGCPWGWARIVDYANLEAPFVAGEYKLPENDPSQCEAEGGPSYVTFTAHNSTATEHLALISWHAGGLQVVDTTDPAAPTQLAAWSPTPLAGVATEDPIMRGHPVAVWSYPIVVNGLIYVTDIRNGLYILRYRGPHETELAAGFREGNSNLR